MSNPNNINREEGDSISARNPDFFVGDNDHGDAVPVHSTPEDIVKRNQELTTKVWMLEAQAERYRKHIERMRIAEMIVASEQFAWLIVGANHARQHILDIRPAYEKWKEMGGISLASMKWDEKIKKAMDELNELDEELFGEKEGTE